MFSGPRSSKPPSALLLAGTLSAAVVALAACSGPSETAASGGAPAQVFKGGNAEFCGQLLAANDYSAAAETAKAAGDPTGVQSNAFAMNAAVENAIGLVPDNAPGDLKKALKRYSHTLERAMTGDELGDQARDTVKDSTKTIKRYYRMKCDLA